MPRHTTAVVVLGGLIALATPAAAGAHPHHPPSRAARPSSSIALLGADHATLRVARGVTGAKPHQTARLVTHGNRSLASSVSADGDSALTCTDTTSVTPLHSLRTKPRTGKPLHVARFSSEGGKGFIFFCEGVDQQGSFALAAGDSQGVAQLVRRQGGWRVDTRVRSKGTNEAGRAHRPGWIRFRRSGTATRYTAVSIAPHALPGGRRLAVAVDRDHGTIAVIQGVGTAKAHNVGLLTSARLVNAKAQFGTGGLAWQPGASDRALIATDQGVAVLDLRHPSRPRLERVTRVGSGVSPGSLTVSSDGDHLAVAAGGRVFAYGHVRAAASKAKRLQLLSSFRLGTRKDTPTDVAFTANGNLLVLHGDRHDGWSLSLVAKVTRGHHVVTGSMPTTQPAASGSLSVWPAP